MEVRTEKLMRSGAPTAPTTAAAAAARRERPREPSAFQETLDLRSCREAGTGPSASRAEEAGAQGWRALLALRRGLPREVALLRANERDPSSPGAEACALAGAAPSASVAAPRERPAVSDLAHELRILQPLVDFATVVRSRAGVVELALALSAGALGGLRIVLGAHGPGKVALRFRGLESCEHLSREGVGQLVERLAARGIEVVELDLGT